jgi:hypothetical protein
MIEWDEKQTWLGVFDILGFRELLRKTDHELHRDLLTEGLNELSELLESEPLADDSGVRCMIFSDTFIVWARDIQPASYPMFLLKCQELMRKSIVLDLPLRGAISAGRVFISPDPSIIIGSSFLEAHAYCEA